MSSKLYQLFIDLIVFLQPDGNLYSVHPFYMCIEPDGRAHAALLYSSNAIGMSCLVTLHNQNSGY